MKTDLSVVIPVYNEARNLEILIPDLSKILSKIDINSEIIVVDDGSIDDTLEVLKSLQNKIPELKILRFRTNFGQTAALSAGFKHSSGSIIITMDGDLQNDPSDIPLLLEKMNEGFDVVSGWRKKRKDAFWTRLLPSKIANGFISYITGVHLHDYGCTLKAYRKKILINFELYGELHRFIPALMRWYGAKITEIPVQHHARKLGESHYGIGRTYRVILDLITVKFLMSFSTQPIHIFGGFGLINFALGLISLFIVILLRITMNFNMTGNPLLYASILFIFTATQFILMGLLAEISIRTYHESQNKPIYAIEQILEKKSVEIEENQKKESAT